MSNKFGINTKIIYQKKTKGWLGDIPSFNYDTNKLKRLGFKKRFKLHCKPYLNVSKKFKD